MSHLIPYDRRAAVEYAHRWAFSRNPAYFDFSALGGDCTNFASQCLYAGTGVMNYTPEFGWYYINSEQRAPSWTGVPFFWDFLTRRERTVGPYGIGIPRSLLRPGDFVQIRFEGSSDVFAHTPVVVSVGFPPSPGNILAAAHSNDVDNRPLDTYENVAQLRYLHILGAAVPDDGNADSPAPSAKPLEVGPEDRLQTRQETVQI